ncbi:MAG: hypothetical protein IPI93_11965 [Sphingobacteriaceae bacterium]|nr:hypothetical protein [Sphingobacteriaceae bacterium]
MNGLTRFFKLNGKICAYVKKQFPSSSHLFVYDPISKTYTYKALNYLLNINAIININYTDVGPTPYVYNDKIYFRSISHLDFSIFIDVNGNTNFVSKMPFTYTTSGNYINHLIVNDKLIINPGVAEPTYGDEPYYFDFTNNNKGLLKDINPYFNYSSSPLFVGYSYFHRSTMKLGYFFATDPDNGTELYFTDGTPSGTKITRNLNAGNGSISFSGSGMNAAYLATSYWHGDTLIYHSQLSNPDSLRLLYKDVYYKAYRFHQQLLFQTFTISAIT